MKFHFSFLKFFVRLMNRLYQGSSWEDERKGQMMRSEHYHLTCVGCGKTYRDSEEHFLLQCEADHGPSLLRSGYEARQFTIRREHPGLFRYGDWLPIRRFLDTEVKTAVFRSTRLAERLGLENLWLAFNGYWPERGAFMETCSFKELEALPVCARVPDGIDKTLVVSSAGNTGRAFLQTFSRCAVPALVVVPEFALPDMWLTVERHPDVKLAVLKGDWDYFDAIQLAQRICCLDAYFPEGGAKNIARRDGMGTVVLAAVEQIGRIPDHYFQSVGSGTGAVAAWEMSVRLREDGRYGRHKMRLHLVQNEPFAVMSDAWNAGRRELEPLEERSAKQRIARLYSPMLSNRKPPYSIAGGVFDALSESEGRMYAVAGEEALLAGWLFETLEGCDLDPAAEVALAGLVRAIRQGKICRSDVVLLNLTGGGKSRLELERKVSRVEPDFVFTSKDPGPRQLEKTLAASPAKMPA